MPSIFHRMDSRAPAYDLHEASVLQWLAAKAWAFASLADSIQDRLIRRAVRLETLSTVRC